ncbi:hypothetical protein V6N13_007885 [Hibiscus sabdariffa]|uniref:Uncharacterized protein n=1 Tax=Hibiscus sabdariffa TaxID=183260 RepID=A0ABR2EBQ5_9ROSI
MDHLAYVSRLNSSDVISMMCSCERVENGGVGWPKEQGKAGEQSPEEWERLPVKRNSVTPMRNIQEKNGGQLDISSWWLKR